MTPEQLPGALEAVAARAANAAAPAVDAMALAYKAYLTGVTLRTYQHAAGQRTQSPEGGPPAYVSGELARSVTANLAAGSAGGVASASVAPHTIYAAIQETGGPIWPERVHYLHWVNAGGPWWLKEVTLPERPYMHIARDQTVRSGLLRRAAAAAFQRAVWG